MSESLKGFLVSFFSIKFKNKKNRHISSRRYFTGPEEKRVSWNSSFIIRVSHVIRAYGEFVYVTLANSNLHRLASWAASRIIANKFIRVISQIELCIIDSRIDNGWINALFILKYKNGTKKEFGSRVSNSRYDTNGELWTMNRGSIPLNFNQLLRNRANGEYEYSLARTWRTRCFFFGVPWLELLLYTI